MAQVAKTAKHFIDWHVKATPHLCPLRWREELESLPCAPGSWEDLA
jgi:hypothetical protein